MEGGIEYLRDVIVHDRLGVCDELERRMQHLVDTYRCEWTEVINDPDRRKLFQQFVNSDATEVGIEIITERGQNRPADWPKDKALVQIEPPAAKAARRGDGKPKPREDAQPQWVQVGHVSAFPLDGGAAIKYGRVQIAVFRFTSRGQWYACQNMCPHKRSFVLSRGIIGSQGEAPKVACPLHKSTFSLESGECLSGDELSVKVFPVKVVDDQVYLRLPPEDQLNALLATDLHCVGACETAGLCTTNPTSSQAAVAAT
jgi:nitrite reductase (NADH) large subunit